VAVVTVGLGLAAGFAYVFLGFSATAEPDEFGWGTVVFGVLVALLTQTGLLMVPWARHRSAPVRAVCFVLLAPTFIGLSGALKDGITRHSDGNPILPSAFLAYAVGVLTYLCAGLSLLLTRRY